MLIQPVNKDESLANEIRKAKQNGHPDTFDIWWLGQSGFLIQWNKQCVLFDPYLSDSLSIKYAGTNKPHERISELVIRPELLNMVDMVTSSHNHTDHLDRETLVPLFRVNPSITFIIPEANRTFVAERAQCDIHFPKGLTDGASLNIGDLTFHGIPAAHNTIERDENGRCKFMGFVMTFGPFSIYHSGDTLWFDELVSLLRPFHLDVAFLPINGNDPARGVAGNLDGAEAAKLGKSVSTRWVIPHHFDLFRFNTADPAIFEAEADRLGQPFHTLRLGGHLAVTK